MHAIEFNAQELEVLRDILRHGLDEIDVEISRTDTHDFRDMLKNRRRVLQALLQKIPAGPVAA